MTLGTEGVGGSIIMKVNFFMALPVQQESLGILLLILISQFHVLAEGLFGNIASATGIVR